MVLNSLASDNRSNSNTKDYEKNKAKFEVGASTGNFAIRKGNTNRLTIRQLNINFLSNKLEGLAQQVTRNIDILMVSETKLNNSFPVSQILINTYSPPFRLYRDNSGGDIMLFVREDIPCKLLSI